MESARPTSGNRRRDNAPLADEAADVSVITEARNFWQRRIYIPVGPRDLVLDIGSGDKPHWRADVLLDWFPDESSAAQRSGYDKARVTRPLFYGDASAMPFRDGAFDYVICSHLLEHVTDPGAVMREMMRVGRAGYIEVPEAASAKIVDFPTHLWWCRLVDGCLDFEAKRGPAFDPEISDYLHRSGLEHDVERMLNSRFEYRVISLRWNTTIPFNVRQAVDPAMLASAQNATALHHAKTAIGPAAVALTVAAVDHLLHRRTVTFNQIVSPDLHIAPDQKLTAQIYRVDT